MSSITQADIDAAKAYYLTTLADPTVTPVFGHKGCLLVRVGDGGGTVYQKQDEGLTTNWTLLGAGGGGGSLPVLAADPVAPAVNDQWFLAVAEVPTTELAGSVPPGPGFAPPQTGQIDFLVTNPTGPDLLNFDAAPGYAITLQDGPVPPAGAQVIGTNPGQGLIVFYQMGATTLQTIANVINAWAIANLSAGLPIMTIQPADAGCIPQFPGTQINLIANGSPSQYFLKLMTTAGVKAVQLA